jgi:hypothetical protein
MFLENPTRDPRLDLLRYKPSVYTRIWKCILAPNCFGDSDKYNLWYLML